MSENQKNSLYNSSIHQIDKNLKNFLKAKHKNMKNKNQGNIQG